MSSMRDDQGLHFESVLIALNEAALRGSTVEVVALHQRMSEHPNFYDFEKLMALSFPIEQQVQFRATFEAIEDPAVLLRHPSIVRAWLYCWRNPHSKSLHHSGAAIAGAGR